MANKDIVKAIIERAKTEEVRQRALQKVAEYAAHPEKQVRELKEEEILDVLKMSYIAKRFFGRTRSWIYHKLNHDIKNGKPDDFTPEERARLKDALDTIAYEIQILSDKL